MMRLNHRLLLCSLLFVTLAAPVVGQDEPPTPDGNDDEKSLLQRMIYVPYRKLRDVFEKQDASVILPYADYLKMVERLAKPKGDKPLGGVITQASYKAVVEDDVARVAVELKVLVTGKPWVRVPVAFGNAAIGKLESDKGKVLLQGTGNGKYELLFSEAGEHTVQLEIVTRVRTFPQGRSLALSTPRVGITNFELSVPKADQSVTLLPKQVVQTIEADGDTTRIKANVGSTALITANWTPRASAKPEMDLLTSVSNTLQVRIDEGLVHRTAKMKFDVLRGEMSELSFVVPVGDRLLDVTSNGNQVRKWSSEKKNNRQVVTVQLLAPTEDDVTLEIHTEQTLPDGEIRIGGVADDGAVHGIHALKVVRESGQVSVTSSKDLAVNVVKQQRVTRTAQTNDGFTWRFYGSNMEVAVTANKIEPRVQAQQSTRYVVTDDNQLKVLANFGFNIERAGLFEIVLNVPKDLAIDNVRGSGVGDFNVNGDKLTVTFSTRKIGGLAFVVEGRQDFAPAIEGPQPLPFLTAENVARETGRFSINSPPAIEVVTEEDSINGLFPDDAQFRGQQAAPTGSRWMFNKTPIAMSISLRRKPPRLTAFAATNIDVQPKVVTIRTQLQFDIQNAGIDTFRFEVPEAFGDTVRITSPTAIKQRTRADAADGWVPWTVVMQQKSQGTTILDVEYDLTILDPAEDADAVADDGEPTEVNSTVQPIRVLAAGEDSDIEPVQVRGEVAISKDNSLSVSADTTGEDIETIDVRELTRNNSAATLAFRYFKQDTEVSLKAVKYAIKSVVETVVNRAAVEVQLGHDSMATYLCRYVITSSERQRLLISLPSNAELLDQSVDGQRISLTPVGDDDSSADWESFYANLGTAVSGSGANKSFRLTLHFRAAIADQGFDPFEGYGGSQTIRIPRVGGEDDAVVTQQLRTAIWVPKDYALIGQPDKFVRDYESWLANSWPLRVFRQDGQKELDSWIGSEKSGMVDFPRKGHSYVYSSMGLADQLTVRWWNMPFSVWIISGSIFLIGFVLRRTPWENKLTVLLIVAFVAVLYSLKDQETVMQALYAGSYGLIAVLILWVIYALRRPAGTGSAGSGSSPPPPSDPPPPEPTPAPTPASAIAVSPPPGSMDSVKKMMGGK